MGVFLKKRNLICSSCKKKGSIKIKEINKGNTSWCDISSFGSKFRRLICSNCSTIFELSPILEKPKIIGKVNLDFINNFDLDEIKEIIYSHKNLLPITRLFELALIKILENVNFSDEKYQKEIVREKESFHYMRNYLESLDNNSFWGESDNDSKTIIPRNFKNAVMQAVDTAKCKSIMNYIERCNYKDEPTYCTICESQEHNDDECPLAS